MISYGFKKTVGRSVEETEELVREVLKEQGFGVLTRIDLKEKLKEKLDVDYRRYVILGACSPANAYAAVQAEEDIGLLLPCNVIVYEKDGKTAVSFVNPTVSMQMIDNEELRGLAAEVESRLRRAFDSIG
jgi:uncharacterized protein (DUF302 family)